MARVMKDSGIEWIGEIPANWDLQKGKYLYCQRSEKGNSVELQLLSPTQKYGVIPQSLYEKISGMKPVQLDAKADLEQFKSIYSGDFCISLRSFQGGFEYSQYNGVVSPAYQVFYRQNDATSDAFYRYIFKEVGFIGYMNSFTKSFRDGKSIAFDDFAGTLLPVPPIAEQQSIADFLDRKCAEIDAVIEKTKATIEEYKKLKQSVITEAVTKGIRGNRPMKNSGIEWIGEIPEEWDLVQIKHLKSTAANAFVDGPFGSNLKSIHYIDNGDVYVVESGFITTGKFVLKKFKTISAEHFETIKRSECKGNDIIIAKIGANFGMAAELPQLDKPSVVSGNSLKITLNQEKILNSIFVYELGVAKAHGGYVGLYNETAQPALSLSALNSFKLVIAPIAEQKEITAYLDEKCAALDTLIAKKTALLTELETYKKSLIYEYVTGKKEIL